MRAILLIGFLVLATALSGCTQQPLGESTKSCKSNDDCVLSSIASDPNLKQVSFFGKRGYGIESEPVEVACISKNYFEENKEKYGLRTYSADFQIWTGSESKCQCAQNTCMEVVYGAPSPR